MISVMFGQICNTTILNIAICNPLFFVWQNVMQNFKSAYTLYFVNSSRMARNSSTRVEAKFIAVFRQNHFSLKQNRLHFLALETTCQIANFTLQKCPISPQKMTFFTWENRNFHVLSLQTSRVNFTNSTCRVAKHTLLSPPIRSV